MAEQRHRSDVRRELRRFLRVTVAACLAIVVPLELAAGWLVPFLLGDAFEGAVSVMRIVLVSGLVLAARRVLEYGARDLGLGRLSTVAEIVSLVALVCALAVFVPLWGVDGAAYALLVAALAGLPITLTGLARKPRRDAGPYSLAGMTERMLASRG
jgi:O-antigen/teichoic acid export membrane protein